MNLLELRPHPFVCAIGISQNRPHNYGWLGKELVSGDIVGVSQFRISAEVGLEVLGRYCQERRKQR
jgi:hypothetical protein